MRLCDLMNDQLYLIQNHQHIFQSSAADFIAHTFVFTWLNRSMKVDLNLHASEQEGRLHTPPSPLSFYQS